LNTTATADGTLHEALLALQAELPTITKDNTADTGKYQYKYADLGAVHDALFPLLNKHGFTWLTAPTLTPHGFALHYELEHSSGEVRAGDYYLPQGTSQEIGSAITYARRYALLAVTGVAPEDDDGAAASRPKPAAEDTRALDALVSEWIEALNEADTLPKLQAAWEAAGRAGVTGDRRVINAKDARKKALQ
jgi:hypothetical protein